MSRDDGRGLRAMFEPPFVLRRRVRVRVHPPRPWDGARAWRVDVERPGEGGTSVWFDNERQAQMFAASCAGVEREE